MLEVYYEEATKVIIAWRGEGRQGIRPVRDGEARVVLDISPPSSEGASVRDYVLDNTTIKLRPDFVTPPPPRDLLAEIDTLRADIKELKKR